MSFRPVFCDIEKKIWKLKNVVQISIEKPEYKNITRPNLIFSLYLILRGKTLEKTPKSTFITNLWIWTKTEFSRFLCVLRIKAETKN